MFDLKQLAEEANRVRRTGALVVALANARRRLEGETISSPPLSGEAYGKVLLPEFDLPGEEKMDAYYRAKRHYQLGMTLGQCTIHYGINDGIVLTHERRYEPSLERFPGPYAHLDRRQRERQFDMFFMPSQIVALLADAPDPQDHGFDTFALRNKAMLDWFEDDLKKINEAHLRSALDTFTAHNTRGVKVLEHYRKPKER